MKAAFIILLSLVVTSFLTADTIVTKNGTYQGRILGASKSSVNFETTKKIITFQKDQILSYKFSASDVLYLKSGETINCKVIGVLKGYVVYVTPQKAFKQKEADVARIENNNGPEVQIKSLPFITNGFIPTPPQIEIDSKKSVRFVYLKFPVMGLLNSSLRDWKNQFETKAGNHPDLKGYPIGGEIGLAVNHIFSLGLGYEYFYYPRITIVDNSIDQKGEDNVSCLFPNIGVKFNIFQMSNHNAYLNANLGLLSVKEKLRIPQGAPINLSGQLIAYKIKAGLTFPISNNISGGVEIGFLSAKIENIKYHGKEIPEYNLDFSGINFSCSLSYIMNF